MPQKTHPKPPKPKPSPEAEAIAAQMLDRQERSARAVAAINHIKQQWRVAIEVTSINVNPNGTHSYVISIVPLQ